MIVLVPSRQQRVALVTGSSRGLGNAIARRLAQDGLAVAVNCLRDDARALAVVDAIEGAGGVAAAFPADVTDERQSVELVAAVTERLGPVDVLVVNATGPQPEAPLMEVSWEDHIAQLEFFVKSPVLLGRAVVPGMRARRWGRIIQIDSEVVDRPPPGRSAYVIAKMAQIGLSSSWARELAPDGITVKHGRTGLRPGRTSRGRPRRDQKRLSLLGAGRPHWDARRHSARRQLLRLGGSRLRHRPAPRRRRRPQSQMIADAVDALGRAVADGAP